MAVPHVLDPLERRTPALNRFDDIVPSRTALLAIDLQRAFLSADMPGYVAAAPATVEPTNRLARALRDAGGLIVFTRHTIVETGPQAPPRWQLDEPLLAPVFDTMKASSIGHALATELNVHPNDLVMDKYRYSAVLPISSPLDDELRTRGIDTVIITGTVSNICCESTARDAHMLGYRVFFVADATAAQTDIDHNATLRAMAGGFADVRLTDEIIAMIDGARSDAIDRSD